LVGWAHACIGCLGWPGLGHGQAGANAERLDGVDHQGVVRWFYGTYAGSICSLTIWKKHNEVIMVCMVP